jgi:hypothetical protein
MLMGASIRWGVPMCTLTLPGLCQATVWTT